MLKSFFLIICFCTFSLAQTQSTNIAQINKLIKNSKRVGKVRFKYYFWSVYDIELFAPNGKYDKTKTFALSLSYLRNLKGKDIAKRSIKEMKKQGLKNKKLIKKYHQIMKNIFPDVSNGSNLVGIKTKAGKSLFFQKGKKIGEIKDPKFGKYFFNIWLGANTSYPSLQKRLLGK